MKITKSENINMNYAAKVVCITEIKPLEGADRLKIANVGGTNIIVDLSWNKNDLAVVFPMETVICPDILNKLNLYSASELNSDSTQSGYFGKDGRVRQKRIRKAYSEGFLLKFDDLKKVFSDIEIVVEENFIFDTIGDTKICWKYVPPTVERNEREIKNGPSQHWWKKRQKKLKRFDRMIDGQFAFHYDTGQLRDNLHMFEPSDNISVSCKIHGTSLCIENIAVKNKLNIFQKLMNKFGDFYPTTKYDVIYSTRKVVQNKYINSTEHRSFYGDGVHGAVYRDFAEFIPEGWRVYGEIVGYKEGSSTFIQKNHDYGCNPGEWKFMPYRINIVDPDGNEEEMPVSFVNEWVHDLKENIIGKGDPLYNKLMEMTMIYTGLAGDMYNLWYEINDGLDEKLQIELGIEKNKYVSNENYNGYLPERFESLDNYKVYLWRNSWIDAMKEDTKLIGMEKREPLCKNKVPREGVVIRINCEPKDPRAKHAYKLKSQAHYSMELKEHDEGVEDIEEMS